MPLKYLTALKNEFVVGLAFSLYFYVPYGCARNTRFKTNTDNSALRLGISISNKDI